MENAVENICTYFLYVWTYCSLVKERSSLEELKPGAYQGNREVEGMGILEGGEENGRMVGEEAAAAAVVVE